MNEYKVLQDRIKKRQVKVCVLGLGYVGLPLAVSFAKKGFLVYGFDTNSARLNKLRKGTGYIVDVEPGEVLGLIKKGKFLPTAKEKVISDSDVIIVCVPTPLRKVKIPDISYIVKASRTIKNYLKKGQLIILESTSFPTTTREVVLPILKKSGLKEEKDFFLCFSPERVNPGDKKFPLTKIPKVIGGLSNKSTQLAKNLYSQIIKNLFPVSSPEIAESAKLLENTFRLVNIALVNEFAILADKLKINIWEVIEAAKTKPFGFMPFYPGPGIGGHCIPQDPMYLSRKAIRLGFKTKVIDLASLVNHIMPKYVSKRIVDLLKKQGIKLNKARVLIVGVSYKKDVKDLRESPALDIIEQLKTKGIKVDFHDPLIPYLKIKRINLKGIVLTAKNIKNYDCSVIVTDHSQVDYQLIRKKAKLIFDTRNVYKNNYSNLIKL